MRWGAIDLANQQEYSSTKPHFQLLYRALAETVVLLDYVTSWPDGLQWPMIPPEVAPTSKALTVSPIDRIEEDIRTPTAILHRIYKIRDVLDASFYESNLEWPLEAAFLSRAKSILSELAAPATSRTAAFTSMVANPLARLSGSFMPVQGGTEPSTGTAPSTAEVAFPELMSEARRLSRSIRVILPILSGFLILSIASIIGLANATDFPYAWIKVARWVAETAYSDGILAALVGLLGAITSILRRFQQLATAQLLDPGFRAKSHIEALLGFVVGGAVGFLWTGMPYHLPGVQLALYAAAFIAGYSTEIVFSLLDRVVAQFSQVPLFQERVPKINTVIKNQSAIASRVLQIHDQIEQIQGNVTLDAFEGAVMVYARRLDGTTLEIDEYNVPVTPGDPTEPMKIRAVKLEPGQTYDLIVVLDRNATSAQDRIVETFSTGESTDGALRSVAFDIELKGRGIRTRA